MKNLIAILTPIAVLFMIQVFFWAMVARYFWG